MRIYTKTGDKGQTSLVYGQRVSKDSLRVEAYGTCDEANSMIGMALTGIPADGNFNDLLHTFHIIQTKLFHVGAELATPQGKKVGWPIQAEDVGFLEQKIDEMDETLSPLKNFILPGGTFPAATLQVARTIVRRAERKAVAIIAEEEVNPDAIKYLNRLSDFLYVAARYINRQMGGTEQNLHAEEE